MRHQPSPITPTVSPLPAQCLPHATLFTFGFTFTQYTLQFSSGPMLFVQDYVKGHGWQDICVTFSILYAKIWAQASPTSTFTALIEIYTLYFKSCTLQKIPSKMEVAPPP